MKKVLSLILALFWATVAQAQMPYQQGPWDPANLGYYINQLIDEINQYAVVGGPNSNITSLSGLTTPLSVAQGGCGSTTLNQCRTNLLAAQSGANPDITSMSGLAGKNGLLAPLNYSVGTPTALAPGAAFTGSISGTTLAVSGVIGTIQVGQTVMGSGVTAGTTIVSGSGTTWTVSTSQTVASESMNSATYTIITPGSGCNVNNVISVIGGNYQEPSVWTVLTLTGGAGSGVATMALTYPGAYSTLPPLSPASLQSFGPLQNTCTGVTATLGGNGVTPNQSNEGINITGAPFNAGAHIRIDATGYGYFSCGSHDVAANSATICFIVAAGRNSANAITNYSSIDFIERNTAAGNESGAIQFTNQINGANGVQELMISKGVFVGVSQLSGSVPTNNADGPGLGTFGALNGYYIGGPPQMNVGGWVQVISGAGAVLPQTPILPAGGGTGGANGSAAATNLSLPYVVCQSAATGMTHTGDTTETNLATCLLPAGIIMSGGSVEISTLWSFTGTTAAKTVFVRLSTASGVTGGAFLNYPNAAANTNEECLTRFWNQTATAQVGRQTNSCNPAAANASLVTTAVNTANPTDLNFTVQLGNAADSATLVAYTVTVRPSAGN